MATEENKEIAMITGPRSQLLRSLVHCLTEPLIYTHTCTHKNSSKSHVNPSFEKELPFPEVVLWVILSSAAAATKRKCLCSKKNVKMMLTQLFFRIGSGSLIFSTAEVRVVIH